MVGLNNMENEMIRNISRNIMMIGVFGLCGAATSVLMVVSAHAQGTPPLPANVPPPGETVTTHPVGVRVVAAPPAGFNPLMASPAAKSQYAIPPMPDRNAAPGAYNRWERAVAGPANRGVAPTLTQTNILNGPARKVGPSVPSGIVNSIVTTTSSNWSGDAVYKSNNPYTVEAIIGEFVVPTAHQAFGSCTGGWDYSSQWPGIDGFGSGDVLQAGTEVDAYCSGGTTASFYSAWIEWYPFSETRVSSPTINPGDLIYIEVWSTSPTNGYAYFYNYSTQQSAEYNLTPPSGTSLVGNSIEWIVERPGVGGGLATLTNYIDSSWPYGVAWNYTAASPNYHYEGQSPAAATLYEITMLDDSNNAISSPTIQNIDFLYFYDYGSAY
jgi:Peptidase A4 family